MKRLRLWIAYHMMCAAVRVDPTAENSTALAAVESAYHSSEDFWENVGERVEPIERVTKTTVPIVIGAISVACNVAVMLRIFSIV